MTGTRLFSPAVILFGVFVCCLARAGSEGPSRPNILFILTDDLGYGDLSCYGHSVIRTPNLDRLAEEGIRFTQFYVTSPVCSPTRASFLTGRHPQRFGIHYADLPEREPRYPLPLSAVTLSEILSREGYRTAHFGKWHLGEPPYTGMPRRHGFDLFFGGLGGRPSSSWTKFARMYDAQFFLNEEPARTYPGHATDVTTDHVLEYLETAAGSDRPFYIDLWYNAPHEPLSPKVEQADIYRSMEGLTEKQAVYYGTVTNLDANIGRVVRKLEQLGIAEKTLVFFSSDNGPESHSYKYAAGSAGPLRGIKTQLWEGGIRVPTIAWMPGTVPAGLEYDSPASSLDFFPTVCELAGVRIPSNVRLDEGISLVPLFTRGGMADYPRTLYFEYHGSQRGGPGRSNEIGGEPSGTLVIRQGDWKLHLFPGLPVRMLYNLREDPGEKVNLVDQYPEIVRRLEAEAREWYRDLPKQENLFYRRILPPETEKEANSLNLP